jgi:pimeloyl-ACP methyl ester carboxylesterase
LRLDPFGGWVVGSNYLTRIPGYGDADDVALHSLADASSGQRIAAWESEPLLDPAADLARLRVPTRLIHGRGDRLIPFTERHRLFHELPETARRGLTVTRLFHHSADSVPAGILGRAVEQVMMLQAIRGLINTV